MKIVIKGNIPAQKNNKQIYVNRATGKPFVASNSNVTEWKKDALWQLKQYDLVVTEYPVSMTIVFYVKDNRRKDMDNMLTSIQDVLVKAGIIEDDSWQFVRPITIDCAGIDKDNPRAEIWIDD